MKIDFPKKLLYSEVGALHYQIIREQVNLCLLHFLKIFHAKDDCIVLTELVGLFVFLLRLCTINLLKPTGYVMHQQFNIQQLYVLPTLYLRVLYLSENKQRLVPLTA